MSPRSLALPPGLDIEWLGVAGYRLTYQDRTLVIDPYLSRGPLASLIRKRPALPDPATVERHLKVPGEAVGVLVSHAHFDHAVDAPYLVRRFGCDAFGSRSLVSLMRCHGLQDRVVRVEPYRRYGLGPFGVTFVPSLHSKIVLGLKVPFDGELTCAGLRELWPSAYRCGQVWGIHIEIGGIRLYHQGSADLIDDAIHHSGVDVFLAGVAGREFTRNYWGRILRRLRPNVVVPSHYDDFFRPLSQPLGFVANVNLARVPEEIEAVSRDIDVVALPRLRPTPG